MAYTLSQMQQILRQAGWPESLIVTMAAIGMAESSGNPRAHNATYPDDSYGLWQINMLGNLGPKRRAQYGLASNSDLYDPLTNARIALDIYQQQGLRAWGPYVTGVYQKYLPASQTAYKPGAQGEITAAAQPQPPAGDESVGDSSSYQDSAIAEPENLTTQALIGAGIGLTLLWLYFRS